MTGSKPRCQCDPTCKNPPLENSPFCAKHIRFCGRQAPLSGSEPEYDPDKYNKHKGLKEAQNCFAYALDHTHLPKTPNCTKDSCPIPYPQPGRASGYPKWSKIKGKRCPDLNARIMGDVYGAFRTSFTQKCPKGMTKIAAVTDEDQDYHFYRQDYRKDNRQDLNGYWSHKPGATDVTNLDATNRPIYDPALAARAYPTSGLNYKNFCGYMCIPVRDHKLKRGGNFLIKSLQKSRHTSKNKKSTKNLDILQKSTQESKRGSRKSILIYVLNTLHTKTFVLKKSG